MFIINFNDRKNVCSKRNWAVEVYESISIMILIFLHFQSFCGKSDLGFFDGRRERGDDDGRGFGRGAGNRHGYSGKIQRDPDEAMPWVDALGTRGDQTPSNESPAKRSSWLQDLRPCAMSENQMTTKIGTIEIPIIFEVKNNNNKKLRINLMCEKV